MRLPAGWRPPFFFLFTQGLLFYGPQATDLLIHIQEGAAQEVGVAAARGGRQAEIGEFLQGQPIARTETASYGCAIQSVYYILPRAL